MPLNYALIEDEPLARSRMGAMLEQLRPGSVCLGEAEDGLSGLDLLRRIRPDVLFLDIEFPPAGAFGLLRAARAENLRLPPIVFVTAYGDHAIEAFRWEAWDYLMKPLVADRLDETLRRVEGRLLAQPDVGSLLQALEAARRHEAPERFMVTRKGRLRVLAWGDVTHLSTENRLLFAHTAEGRFPLDRTLDELEGLLSPAFFRCHRGAMVALAAVREVKVEDGGSGELTTTGGDRLPVSRERMPALRRCLNG
ncbi:LytR/AlgR family response regulator transcription factor [Mesoterricola silvestris]|uniref:DNA-binding response regulator n=1 Tax=Mesoterricola silvestris TaxID=2927979 RepID=A0AA48K898_9BACT|nr:LytTR family DNA-binding domain-containing protein [Mesoterricola silvestris]BDU72709.1 DNA-binding response regulator [Mesoterricola silvestris]